LNSNSNFHMNSTPNFTPNSTPVSTPNSTPNSSSSMNSTSSAAYTVESLHQFNVEKLREICSKFNIRPGRKRKHELIEHMVSLINPSASEETEFASLKMEINNSINNGEPPQHAFYRKYFNGVDLHDRYWYKISYNYHVRKWQAAYFFCIFKVALINSWVLHSEIEVMSLENYLTLLSVYLLSPQ